MMNAIQGGKTAGWGKSNNVVIGTILFVMILVWVPILISPDADTGIVTDTSISIDNHTSNHTSVGTDTDTITILVSVPILNSIGTSLFIMMVTSGLLLLWSPGRTNEN